MARISSVDRLRLLNQLFILYPLTGGVIYKHHLNFRLIGRDTN